MGYVMVTSACCGCGQNFSYNPHRVPSCRIRGEREPICQSCVDRANPIRIAKGFDPIVVLPDAYEPLDETEL